MNETTQQETEDRKTESKPGLFKKIITPFLTAIGVKGVEEASKRGSEALETAKDEAAEKAKEAAAGEK